MYYETTPISRNDLRTLAYRFRKQYNCDNTLILPILDILEQLSLEGLVDYYIVADDDKALDKDIIANYNKSENMIYIKESVYHEAASNIGRSRFTLAHELSHFILLTVKEFEIKKTDTKPVCYKDPEWQANTLASELLVPYYETQNMTVEEITTSCNVSEECAIVVYRKRQKKMSPTNRL